MDYSRPKQNLKGVVLALGMVCAASNAFAVSLEAPAGERGNFTPPHYGCAAEGDSDWYRQ